MLAPSNPVVGIGAILARPGIRAALREAAAPIVGCRRSSAKKPLRSMADARAFRLSGCVYRGRCGPALRRAVRHRDTGLLAGTTATTLRLTGDGAVGAAADDRPERATAEMVRAGCDLREWCDWPRTWLHSTIGSARRAARSSVRH